MTFGGLQPAVPIREQAVMQTVGQHQSGGGSHLPGHKNIAWMKICASSMASPLTVRQPMQNYC